MVSRPRGPWPLSEAVVAASTPVSPAITVPAPGFRSEIGASWRVMIVVVLGMFIGTLPGYSIGAFITPLSHEFGWTITQVATWSLFWSIGCICAAPLVGALADRLGARKVALTAVAILAVVLLATGLLTQGLPTFYVSGFAVGAVIAGTSGITYGRIVSNLFEKGLGTALGLMSTGIGISAVIGPRVMQGVIDAYGWRSAFMVEAALPFVALPLLALWLREEDKDRDSKPGELANDGHALKTASRMPAFWLLAMGSLIYGMGVGGVSTNLMPFLTSSGLSRANAAAAAGLFGAATIAGRFSTGIIIDRSRIHASVLMALVLAFECVAFIIIGATGTSYLLVALPIFGLAVGAEADCLAYCTVRIFGRRAYSSIFGILGIVMLYIGTGTGPPIFAALREGLGDYSAVFYIWAGLTFAGTPIFLLVSRYPFFRQTNGGHLGQIGKAGRSREHE